MQQLVSSSDASYVLSVQLALDAHGIRHSEQRWGFSGAAYANRVLVGDADFERAATLIAGLQETSPCPAEASRVSPRVAAVTVVALLVLCLVVAVLASR